MTTESAPAADSGSLSVDQGIAALRALSPEPAAEAPADDQIEAAAEQEDETEAAAEAPDGDVAGEDDPQSEAEPAAEDDPGAETPAEDDPAETVEPAEPVADAPHFWPAEAKAKFAALPPELQLIVAEQAKAGDRVVTKAVEEAAQARKTFEGQASQATQLAEELNAFLPDALKTFADRWAGVQWAEWAKVEPDKALAARFEFEAEQEQLGKLQAATAEANRQEHERFVTAEADTLSKLASEHAPELLDPKVGQGRRVEIGQYLVGSGIPAERLANISAVETIVAYKAMMFDRATATAKAAAERSRTAPPVVRPKPAAPPVRAAVRPSASPASASPRQSTLQAAERRLDREGSMDAGIAALRARRNAKG